MLSEIPGKYEYLKHEDVLILVLMEYALWESIWDTKRRTILKVLILVLMEYALWGFGNPNDSVVPYLS